MKDIIKIIKATPDAIYHKGVNTEQIKSAEKALALKFSKEYTQYLQEFGIVTYGSHELTGLGSSQRLSVVECTKFEREHREKFPNNMYVIEDTHMEGIVIMQDDSGDIFEVFSDNRKKLLCHSLCEYIALTSS